MKEKVMNGLEKFSKAMLSPLSYISAAGLILVLGALLTSTSLSAMIPVLQWTPIKLLGQLIYNCIMVIINNLSLMFCVGIAAALAKKNKQQAAIIGLMSYFMYLTAGNVTLTQLGMLAEADPMVGLYGTGQSTVFGIQTVDMGVFGGIKRGRLAAHGSHSPRQTTLQPLPEIPPPIQPARRSSADPRAACGFHRDKTPCAGCGPPTGPS
jgi:PTS system maltose and glucose-specific IIC component